MKKLLKAVIPVIALCLSFPTGAFASDSASPVRIVAEKLQYDNVRPIRQTGLICVGKNGLYGCIDYNGNIVIPVESPDISDAKGFILAKTIDGSYVLYDEKGVIHMDSAVFANALEGSYSPNSLSIGRNIVALFNSSGSKFVDFNGNEITKLNEIMPHKLSGTVRIEDNLINIDTGGNGSYYIDCYGNEVLPKEDGILYMDFSDGVVLKAKINPGGGYYLYDDVTPIAFYDMTGKLVCNVPDVANGSQNYVAFSYTDLATLLQFSEGYAAYEDKNTKLVGFIDKTGEIAIPARFDRCVLKFSEGVAGVYLPNDDNLSYIDTKGNILFSIPTPDPWPRGCVNGLFINSHNTYPDNGIIPKVIGCDMKGNTFFSSEGIYEDDKLIKYSYAFGSGAPVESEIITSITIDPYSYTAIMQTTENKYGLNDLNGNEILPAVYEYIEPLQSADGRLLLMKDDEYMIVQITPAPLSTGQAPIIKPVSGEDKPIDSGTAQFILGDWKVKTFLGYQMFTKEGVEYLEEKMIGKDVIIAHNLFSTKDFEPEYEEYAVHTWIVQYTIVDVLSGGEFTANYKASQDVTRIENGDRVMLIQAEAKGHELIGPILIDVNHERLLILFNDSYYELGKNIWFENDMAVSILDPDVNDDGYYHVGYRNNVEELIPENEHINLLMINGGFVPCPEIKIFNGRALTPVKNILEPFGVEAKQVNENRTIIITKNDVKISLTIDSIQAEVNGDMKELDAAPTVINGNVYVPVRFIAEAFGADVEYIAELGGAVAAMQSENKDGAVSVISIELPGQASTTYSPDEGLAKVKEASAVKYQELLDFCKESNRTFDDEYQKDYDSQDIIFTGQVYDRYYVYRLNAFSRYNIFFNKYTGEIYSETAALPFLFIAKGFINISWMYQ